MSTRATRGITPSRISSMPLAPKTRPPQTPRKRNRDSSLGLGPSSLAVVLRTIAPGPRAKDKGRPRTKDDQGPRTDQGRRTRDKGPRPRPTASSLPPVPEHAIASVANSRQAHVGHIGLADPVYRNGRQLEDPV